MSPVLAIVIIHCVIVQMECQTSLHQSQSFILGGADAVSNSFPHQVSLQWGLPSDPNPRHFCGGIILNELWILTAAHCIDAVPEIGGFLVKAGKHVLNRVEPQEQARNVAASFSHEAFLGDVAPFDIGLVRLRSPLVWTYAVRPIDLPRKGSMPSGRTILSGWGALEPSGALLANTLQTVELPIVDLTTCRNALRPFGGSSTLHRTNICTGPLAGDVSPCNGDSGGPLIQRRGSNVEVVGIVSWGVLPCGLKGAPSVFVRVSAFIDWIQDTMRRNPGNAQ